jgi:putative heme-binding domain-containing protein
LVDCAKSFCGKFHQSKIAFIYGKRLVIRSGTQIHPSLFVAVFFLLIQGIASQAQEKSAAMARARIKAGDSTAAEQAFSANCAGCHGLDGKGGERAPDIVTRLQVRQLSDAELLQILQRGVPNTSMPAFQFLDEKTQRSLVSYLRTLQGTNASAKLAGNAERGKEIFSGRGACSGCHAVRGRGGFFATDLTNYASGRSPETVREAIVWPNRFLDPRKRTVVVTLPDGRTLEGIARNEDNFSLQLITPDGTLHLLSKPSLAKLTYKDESPMPSNYGTKLSASELDDLVNYLTSVGEKQAKPISKDEPAEE